MIHKRSFAIAALLTLATTSCQSSAARSHSSAPPIKVVTALYPLAQAVQQIAGPAAAVVDVVPAGADPRTYALTPGQVTQARTAGLILTATAGFQPSLDRAAAANPHVARVTKPYDWLDPASMKAVAHSIATALVTADPAAAADVNDGATAFIDQLSSTAIDYENTLSACPRRDIVTSDDAFAAMARAYGLTDTIASNPTQIYPRSLDTLMGPPSRGWPKQATYINLLEANLGALSRALGCPGS